jgi:hypothetical protein
MAIAAETGDAVAAAAYRTQGMKILKSSAAAFKGGARAFA